MAKITGEERGWTIGQQARHVVKWIGAERNPSLLAVERLAETRWHYRMCKPGEYEHAELWDLKAAYWQILSRFEVPTLIWTQSGFIPVDPGAEVEQRWNVVIDTLAGEKRLRNALVGAMVGGGSGAIAFRKGELFSLPVHRGKMHDFGAAVVRVCYELTELQAASCRAVYANTDNVMIDGGGKPGVWDALGFTSNLEASGEADVRCLGCYRCGDKRTSYYDEDTNIRLGEASPQLAEAGYWRAMAL